MNKVKYLLIALITICSLSMNSIGLHAYYSENSVPMYNGRLVAAIGLLTNNLVQSVGHNFN